MVNRDGTEVQMAVRYCAKMALEFLLTLDDFQRGQVLCWFCQYCHRYIGPGDSCDCHKNRE